MKTTNSFHLPCTGYAIDRMPTTISASIMKTIGTVELNKPQITEYVESFVRILSLRDLETEEHTWRVASMAYALACLTGVPQSDLPNFYYGSLLHDIGKIGIPDSILRKKSALTKKEMLIMRAHPVYAYEILRPISELRDALDIPYCHHEKWDGSGYPRGLGESQIPFSARLFAVVDVWDALTSERPYRPAWNKEQAVNYLHEQSGKHFDPYIVGVFLEEFMLITISEETHPTVIVPEPSFFNYGRALFSCSRGP